MRAAPLWTIAAFQALRAEVVPLVRPAAALIALAAGTALAVRAVRLRRQPAAAPSRAVEPTS